MENKTDQQGESAEQGVRLERLVVSTQAGVAHEQPAEGRTATRVMINEPLEEFKPALCRRHRREIVDITLFCIARR